MHNILKIPLSSSSSGTILLRNARRLELGLLIIAGLRLFVPWFPLASTFYYGS